MLNLVKSILFWSEKVGAAPYIFGKNDEDVKIKSLRYTWTVVFLVFIQRFYIIWCRFFEHSFSTFNVITKVANSLDSIVFDICNESICFIFCINSVYKIKDVLVKIRAFSKTELKFDSQDVKFVLYWSHSIFFLLTFLYIIIHVIYYFDNPFLEKNQIRHLLFTVFFVFSAPFALTLSTQALSFTLISFTMFRKINILMQTKLQNIMAKHLRSELAKSKAQQEICLEENIKSIKRMRSLYDLLEDLTESVVEAFSPINFFGFTYCFTEILFLTNYFVLDQPGVYNFLFVIWVLYLFCKIFLIVAVSTYTTRQFISLVTILSMIYDKLLFKLQVYIKQADLVTKPTHLKRFEKEEKASRKVDLSHLQKFSDLAGLIQEISQDLNDSFSFINLISIAYSFVDSLYAVYFSYFVGLVPLISFTLWISYVQIKVLATVITCASVKQKAEQTAQYLHELLVENDDPEIKEELEIFSLQLIHRKIEFNAWGFFKLDFTLIYSMVGAVTTYIVILMQFQDFSRFNNVSKNCPCQPDS